MFRKPSKDDTDGKKNKSLDMLKANKPSNSGTSTDESTKYKRGGTRSMAGHVPIGIH